MISADNLGLDRRALFSRSLYGDIMPALFRGISAEAGIARDVFQRAGDRVTADRNILLEVRNGYPQEVYSCVDVSAQTQLKAFV